jgi:hypothetical protein
MKSESSYERLSEQASSQGGYDNEHKFCYGVMKASQIKR